MSTTSDDKIKFESLVNATIKTSNSTDTARTYAIEANVAIRNNAVETIDNGSVKDLSTEVMLASFSKYYGVGLNMSFTAEVGESQQCSILGAINSFIAEANEKIATSPTILSAL